MRFKDTEIEIPQDNPFKNDLFQLSAFSEALTNLTLSMREHGAVIGLNAMWGGGKTTFLKMWEQTLINKGFTTITLNAWECDYHEDPFIALLGELYSKFNESIDKNELFETVFRMGKRVCFDLLNHKFGIDVDKLQQAYNDLITNYVESYTQRKESLKKFKSQLQKLVKKSNSETPLIFIIDEIDRCNPHFSIRLLECIKHLFDIPNIVFVLGINLNQMQHAVEGFYGSTNIDGKDYLRRFINLEINLPTPKTESYIDAILNEHCFIKCFEKDYTSLDYYHQFSDLCKYFLNRDTYSLRTIFRILSLTRVAFAAVSDLEIFGADMLFFMILIKFCYPDTYQQLESRTISIDKLLYQLETNFAPLFAAGADNLNSDHDLIKLFARLTMYYNYSGNFNQKLERDFIGQQKDNGPDWSYPYNPTRISKDILDSYLTYYESKDRLTLTGGLKHYFQILNFIGNIDSINLKSIAT